MEKYKVERINGDRYYRGVYIFQRDNGFSYRFAQRTDTFSRSDMSVPYTLKDTTIEIDKILLKGFGVINKGTIVYDTRTKINS